VQHTGHRLPLTRPTHGHVVRRSGARGRAVTVVGAGSDQCIRPIPANTVESSEIAVVGDDGRSVLDGQGR
jgi:hypothetical protein